MDSAGKTQITVAVITVAGVIGAAVIAKLPEPSPHPEKTHEANKAHDAKTSEEAKGSNEVTYTLKCSFVAGPLTGQTINFAGRPGVIPAPVGAPCTDGYTSQGIAVPE